MKFDGRLRRIIVYPSGPNLKTEDEIEVIPFDHFAEQLTHDFLLKPKMV